jgi:23S rRNA pseudouridine1911/1915/1917 synthase
VEPKVIYEDDRLLVLDKPSGWVVNEAVTTGENPVIQTWLVNNFNFPTVKDRELRSGIVHRLDKETSGVLLIAKTSEMFVHLQQLFKERKVEKSYIALVHEKPANNEGVIESQVGRLPWNRERFGVLPGGREAVTGYKVLSVYGSKLSDGTPVSRSNYQADTQATDNRKQTTENRQPKPEYSLIELHPKTGRTHQIRIHLKHIGHPIVADAFYAGRKTARKDRKWCPRLFLHAASIEFTYPERGKVRYEADLAHDLQNALNTLVKISNKL